MDECDMLEKVRELSLLLVEDNPGDADLIGEMLGDTRTMRIHVEQVSRLSEAFTQLERVPCDVVLLDLGLPDSSGLETLRAFRLNMPDVPVIVLTGLDDDQAGLAAVAQGAQGYLVKGQISEILLRRTIHHGIERSRTQRELRDSKQHLDMALGAARMGTYDWDLVTNQIKWSREHEELWGYAPGTFGGSFAEFESRIHPEDVAGIHAEIQRVKAARTEFNHEWRVVWSEGSIHWISGRGQFYYKEEEPVQMVGVVQDITEKKLAEEALRKERDFARDLVNTAQVVVLVLDKEGRILNFNPYFEEISGYSLEEMKGCDWFSTFIPVDARDEIRVLFQQSINKIQTKGKISSIVTMEGRLREIEWYDKTLKDSEGTVIGLLCTGQDVTERRLLENERARLEAAVESIPESVMITDRSGTIVYVNKGFELITGYGRSEAIGNKVEILESGKQDKAFNKQLWDTIERGKVWSGRFVNKRKDDSFYTGEATISPIFDDTGRVTHYVSVQRDISVQIAAEERNLQAQKLEAVGTLAGGIAHDFNNVLGIILGYGQMILDDLPEDSPSHDNMNEVIVAANRAASLVRQILTFSRKGDENKQPLQLALLVKEAVKFFKASIPSTILINADVDSQCPLVLADPTQMHQVLMNLCTNAYHAMQEKGGKLNVTLKPFDVDADFAEDHPGLSEGAYLLLSVRDTGSGIPPEVLARIFDPFFTTKAQGKGTGLGLATTHGIVTAHGGIITVYSEVGNGTIFHVYLPSVEAEMAETPTVKEPVQSGQETILVVDDEPAMAHTIEKGLMRLGYAVTAVNNSVEALEIFRANPHAYDLLLTDQTMPGMTGEMLSREVLQLRPGMPIIINTGFSDLMTAEKAKEMGISGFLMKPAEIRKIAKLVREVLDSQKD